MNRNHDRTQKTRKPGMKLLSQSLMTPTTKGPMKLPNPDAVGIHAHAIATL